MFIGVECVSRCNSIRTYRAKQSTNDTITGDTSGTSFVPFEMSELQLCLECVVMHFHMDLRKPISF